MAKPIVSIVCSTRNRAPRLPPFFDALIAMNTAVPFEVVIVDNGSTDDTTAVVESFRARLSGGLTLLHEAGAGVGRAKNKALAAVRGQIIAFVDDDCYVAPDYVDALWRAFQNAQIGFLCGRVELFDPEDEPVTIKTDRNPINFPPRRLILPGAMHGANMAYRREVIERIGPFDILFGPGAPVAVSDDTDYFQRASACGFTGIYDPGVCVYHHHRRRKEHLPGLMRDYSVARGAFYAKVITTYPSLIINHISEQIRNSPSLLADVKQFYWKHRGGLLRRSTYIYYGALRYWAIRSLYAVNDLISWKRG